MLVDYLPGMLGNPIDSGRSCMSEPIITTSPSVPRPPTQPAPTGPANPVPIYIGITIFTRDELDIWAHGLRSILTGALSKLAPDTVVGAELNVALQFVTQIDQILARPISGPVAPLPK